MTRSQNRLPEAARLDPAVSEVLAQGWTAALPYADLTDLGRAALDAARRVFALPVERKAAFVDPTGAGNAGWRPVTSDDRPNEVWQLGGGQPDLWPDEVGPDRVPLLRLRARCVEVVAELLEALAPSLGLSRAELRDGVSVDESVIRLLRYGRRDDGIAFAPHTDLGIATFFAAESVPALELQDGAGQWQPIGADFAVAAGEMLAARCGDTVRAGRHRVRSSARERWSVAVFVHPEPTYALGTDDGGTPLTARELFQRAMCAHTGRPAAGAADSRRPGT